MRNGAGDSDGDEIVKRRLLHLLAGVSLSLLVAMIVVWKFSPKHWITFNLFGHPMLILSTPRGGIQLRLNAADLISVSKAGLNLSATDTGADFGSFSSIRWVIYWGSGYSLTNLSANSPAMVPARRWRAIGFDFYVPIVFLAISTAVFILLSIKMRPHAKDHCHACGYDLRATPDRCPECGTIPAKPIKVET